MPAIAYTSGAPWWELPTIGGRAWEPFGHPGSVFGSQGSTEALCLSDLKVPGIRFARQPPLTGSRIGTQHTELTTSPELRNETRTRTRIP